MTTTLHFRYNGEIVGGLAMPTSNAAPNKRETLNLRIKPELRGLIDLAAGLLGQE